MVHTIATRENRKLTANEFRVAICRNFGGLDDLDPMKVFQPLLTMGDVCALTSLGFHRIKPVENF